MKIDLNPDEAKALINLIDAANKALGIQAAEAALHFVRKINIAAKAEEDEKAQAANS